MRLTLNIAAVAMLLLPCILGEENKWSWQADDDSSNTETQQQAESTNVEITQNISANSTEAQQIIDEILVSNRQGRNLDGFDEVYSDPNVQEALQKGDDGEARNIIKDRLCNLGLMSCEGGSVQEKRPYISPEDLIYAQPVAINPVGRPIPTIPVNKGPNRGTYGPPKPVPFPSQQHGNKFGPPGPPHYQSGNRFGPPLSPPSLNKPPRRGYGPPFQSVNSNKYYGNKQYLNEHEIYEGQEFLSKPPGFVQPIEPDSPPYQFEAGQSQFGYHKDKNVEVVVHAQGGSAKVDGGLAGSGLQQHVHHHYHHNLDGNKSPTVVVNPIPVASAAAVSSSLSSSSLNSFGGSFSDSSLFKPSSSGFNPINPSSSFGSGGLSIGGTYGGQTIANYGGSSGLSNFGSSPSKPIYENYGPQSFGASVGSYGSSGLYKKELNLNSGNSNYLQSSYADKYQGLESARTENYDCVCVPYDQCPSHDIIGRKDDLYLALDPRNLKTDIEALAEDERVITDGNGTMTIVRVPKGVNLNETETEEETERHVEGESKTITKREAPVENKEQDKAKVEARQSQYGSVYNNKKVKPTFGVSFGLPNQGGGGYPISPYGPNPLVNPYGGSVGGQGINLGLVSVNPLISLQVTKDDYGEKVLKPFVNLHVTPNNYLVHKFEDLLSHKKHLIFNKHKHFHYHKPPHHHEPYYPHDGHISYTPPPHDFHHHGYGHDHHHGYGHDFAPGPVEYDGPPIHHGPQYDGPPIHHGPQYDSPPIHHSPHYAPDGPEPAYYDDSHNNYGGGYGGGYDDNNFYGRAYQNSSQNLVDGNNLLNQYQNQFNQGQNNYADYQIYQNQAQNNDDYQNQYQEQLTDIHRGGKSLNLQSSASANPIKFPSTRKRRDLTDTEHKSEKRQAFYGGNNIGRPQTCGPRHVCCRRPVRPQVPTNPGIRHQCGTRHSQGINGRIKNPVYVDGDSEFGEYPWQVAILKKDPKESVYVCGGTLIDPLHIITAAHCVKTYTGFDLRVRLGEWDVNHDVEFFPYIEREITSVNVHPEFYAGTLYNDLAILRMDKPVDFSKYPHISPACLPNPHDDYTSTRCWTTGWGKDAFGDFGKYQNILKEVDVPIVNHGICERQLKQTRLGYDFQLHPGFVCAGGEEGKDACKGDGGGPMVCERGGTWQVVGVVSWGIGCGQVGVPGVYVKVAHYLDWIRQVTQRY